MREYIFDLEYRYGVHPIRDVFINHPDVIATGLDVSITHEGGWRIERLSGPEEALDSVQMVFLDERCNDCTYPTPECDTEHQCQVLEQEATARTIYRHVTEMSYCSSLGYLALQYLGKGLVFGTTMQGPSYEWRLLIPTDRDIEGFYGMLREELPEGISLSVRRAGDLKRWFDRQASKRDAELPYEQREALEIAWEMGYFEHPRTATMEEIATELGLATTTLRYRLRRAQAWATKIALGEQYLMH